MKLVFRVALLCLALAGCEKIHQVTPEDRLREAVSQLGPGASDRDRFYALPTAAKESFTVGQTTSAQGYAEELLALAEKFPKDWNYGNAIHDGNMVLGRVAAKSGQFDLAKGYLLKAGRTPGSPQINTFGPNMSLAQDLLATGEREAVIAYFHECRRFWEMHEGRLDQWAEQVKAGKQPQFGANLYY
jgi:hypothetical protein